ncbi:Probable 2,4-dienoyl-CoA reductase [Chlamydiales bacterium SCGC AG-110-P3]|nr:Probable 2,4-dienoyl-CoA reductase [Chlamydiales bacterium SCGC AG-110-P3]
MSCFRSDLLSGHASIVTGGTSGIGFEIAKAIVEHGGNVTVTGRDAEKMQIAVDALGKNARGDIGDVRDADSVASNLTRHLEVFGRLDSLVNNAAGNFLCPLEKMTENAFRAVNDIVSLGTFLWSKAAFDPMKQQGGGRIINIGTHYVDGHGAMVAHSGAAKAAVFNLTKSIAVEWGRYGIRANMIAPGPVEGTEGVRRLLGAGELPPAFRAFMPVGRMASGEEIAGLALYLLAPISDYINGTIIYADGGLHLNSPGLMPPLPLPPSA